MQRLWLKIAILLAVGAELGCGEKARNVFFRGLGQEPGWTVEVSADHVRFTGDYGQRAVFLPRSAVETDSTAERIVYRSERLTVVIEPKPCTDAMSGEPFSHTVRVTVDGDTYRGCGRFRR